MWFFLTIRAIWRLNYSYYKTIKKAFNGKEANWLARDGDPRMFYALILFARKHREKLRIVVYFHNHPSKFLLIPAKYLIRWWGLNNLIIAAEDPGLAEKYSEILGVKASYLCNLLPVRKVEIVPQYKNQLLGALMLGGARIEKGIDVLAAAVESLVEELKSNQLSITVQLSGYKDERVDAVKGRFKKLILEGVPNIHLIEETLDEDAYLQFLNRADFLLLPYRKDAYALRNSGIVLEAISADKPMIVADGTLVAETAIEKGSALIFSDGDSLALANGIRKMVSDYDKYSGKAKLVGEKWRCQNAPEALLMQVFGYSQ
jgi:glycosyltransferase involved in cell wall biosynthesis